MDHNRVRSGKGTKKDTDSPYRKLERLVFQCASVKCSYIKSFGKIKNNGENQKEIVKF